MPVAGQAETTPPTRAAPAATGRTRWSGISPALTEFAALTLLALPMLAPLLAAAVPQTHDGFFHTYRSIVLAWHLSHGELYPRLASDLGYGYGLPLFNFYAPLFYYPTALLILLRVDPALSANLTAALSVLLAGWGVLKLGREWFGEAAGWAAAASLLYAPYFLLDLYSRAAFPEVLGLALLPWGMLACFRLARRPGRRRAWLGAAVVTGLALLAHNIGAIWAPPYLAGALGAGWLFSAGRPPRARLRQAGLAAGALLLGLGLAAFLVLPALAELPFIQSSRLTVPGFLDYHNNFLKLGELLALPRPFDPTQVGQVYPRSLGLVQIGLAAAGLLFVWREPRPTRWLWLALLGASLLAAALTQAISLPLWDALGPMKFIQFPWRWLGPASLTLSLLAGYGAARAAARLGRWAPIGLAGLLALIVAANLSWAFTTYNPRLANSGIEAVRQFERKSGLIGLSTQGEFLPIWVTQVPEPDSLAGRVTDDNLINRVGPDSLPAGARLISVDNRLTQTTIRVSAPAAGEIVFDWFYFPGWRATVNGQAAEIQAVAPSGRIGVMVPAGQSEVRVEFGSTPVRAVGWAISLLALAGIAAVAWRLRPATRAPALPAGAARQFAAGRSLAAAAAIVGLVLGAWRIGLVDRGLTPWLQARLQNGAVRGVAAPLSIVFGDQLALLGWDPPAPVPSGETAGFRVYWQALQPLTRDYSIATHLLDENGLLVAQSDSMHPGGTPTSVWAVDRYDIDEHQMALPAGLPPGEYRLFAGVYLAGAGEHLAPIGGGVRAGQLVEFGTIQVTRPTLNLSPAELPIGRRLDAALGPIRLIGLDVSAASIRPGDDLIVTSYWAAVQTPGKDYIARFELTGAAGAHYLLDAPPASRGYPTSQWVAGELLRGTQVLRVPAAAAPGPMVLTVTLVDAAGLPLAPAIKAGSMEVQPVARTFTAPDVPVPIGANLGAGIRLEGATKLPPRAAPGETLPITLFWQSLELVPDRYSVFVHLLDAGGVLRAQIDSPPLAGARPTTSWLPGEFLTDAYGLALPAGLAPGTYRLEVGMYRPDTGERLAVAGAADSSILIGEIVVSE